MICNPIEPRGWKFNKSFGFLSFAKNLCKNIGKKRLMNKRNIYIYYIQKKDSKLQIIDNLKLI